MLQIPQSIYSFLYFSFFDFKQWHPEAVSQLSNGVESIAFVFHDLVLFEKDDKKELFLMLRLLQLQNDTKSERRTNVDAL